MNGVRWCTLILAALGALTVNLVKCEGQARAETPVLVQCPEGQSPSLSFLAPSFTVPVGGAALAPPTLDVSCNGAPVNPSFVQFKIVAGTASVSFQGSPVTEIDGEAVDPVATPAVTSGLTPGSFTVEASWGGASASIAGEVTGQIAGIVPPQEPAGNIKPTYQLCPSQGDTSPACLIGSAANINVGRRTEGLGPLLLPTNWTQLSVPQQLLVLADLERGARGLPDVTGLTEDLNAAAQVGAERNEDPGGISPGAFGYASNWAGGAANSIEATFSWIYDDGLDPDGMSFNLDCHAGEEGGCWGHRNNILYDGMSFGCQAPCVMGAGYSTAGHYGTSYTQLFNFTNGPSPDPMSFTWVSELPYLPTCEQVNDTCSWTDVPSVPAAGGSEPRSKSESPGVQAYNKMRNQLLRELVPSGRAAKLRAIVKRGGYVFTFTTLLAGRVKIAWYYLPKGAHLASKARPVLVAKGQRAFSKAGSGTFAIKLTAAGRHLLAHSKRIRLTASGIFQTTGVRPIAARIALLFKR